MARIAGCRIHRARVDRVGGPPAQRVLELLRPAVDRDDRRRAGQPRSGNHVEADAAAADHADPFADPHPGGAGDRSDARHHPAAQQRRLPERDVGRDRNRTTRGNHRELCEAGHHQRMLEHGAVGRVQARAPLQQQARGAVAGRRSAQRPVSRAARLTDTARRHEAKRDVIARSESVDVLSDRLDDARSLVAEHHRPAAGPEPAVRQMQVGVADARGGDAHEHLATPRRLQQHRLDAHRTTRLAEHASPHVNRMGRRHDSGWLAQRREPETVSCLRRHGPSAATPMEGGLTWMRRSSSIGM